MPKPRQKSTPTNSDTDSAAPVEASTPAEGSAPLSLSRLRAAFAQMLGTEPVAESPATATTSSPPRESAKLRKHDVHVSPATDPCEISPRTVVEAMLFVGRADDRPFSARELAVAMRGVSPAEVEAAVRELNQTYERDAAPYEISATSAGYRLALRDDFGRMRDKFHGRLREAKLSPAAVEVLSTVAYYQPTTAEAINELRGASSGAALAWLVRRKLVQIERPAERGGKPTYSTTDRFLRLFGLESVAELPRGEELEKF
jgi:segregation and condensation protein B